MKNIWLSLVGGLLSAGAVNSQATDLRYTYLLSNTVPYAWEATGTAAYDVWKNADGIYACSNWSPSTATIGKGVAFVQTATDCKQDQERTAHPQRKDKRTGRVEYIPDAEYQQKQTIPATLEQNAVGILENWTAYDPAYTNWTDTNSLYGCQSWSPDPSTYTATTQFTQKSDLCSTDQERIRQDQEQEHFTLEVRDSGLPVTEKQTLTKQSARRLYSVALGNWTDVGAKYACSDWSPDPSTVGINLVFTQSATDCKQNQVRTRTESYVDNQSGSTVGVTVPVEVQTLTGQTGTQNATGTKETWVATTPAYSAWANTSEAYGCTNWSPAASTITNGQAFTQTASDCSVNQSRTRQDRQIETTTGAIRNNDSAVTETQIAKGQTGYQTAYGTYLPLPGISNFYASKSPTQHCGVLQSYGTLVWASNAASHTLVAPNGQQFGLGKATSYSSVVGGRYTLYACNSAGACSTAIANVVLAEAGGGACN